MLPEIGDLRRRRRRPAARLFWVLEGGWRELRVDAGVPTPGPGGPWEIQRQQRQQRGSTQPQPQSAAAGTPDQKLLLRWRRSGGTLRLRDRPASAAAMAARVLIRRAQPLLAARTAVPAAGLLRPAPAPARARAAATQPQARGGRVQAAAPEATPLGDRLFIQGRHLKVRRRPVRAPPRPPPAPPRPRPGRPPRRAISPRHPCASRSAPDPVRDPGFGRPLSPATAPPGPGGGSGSPQPARSLPPSSSPGRNSSTVSPGSEARGVRWPGLRHLGDQWVPPETTPPRHLGGR